MNVEFLPGEDLDASVEKDNVKQQSQQKIDESKAPETLDGMLACKDFSIFGKKVKSSKFFPRMDSRNFLDCNEIRYFFRR